MMHILGHHLHQMEEVRQQAAIIRLADHLAYRHMGQIPTLRCQQTLRAIQATVLEDNLHSRLNRLQAEE